MPREYEFSLILTGVEDFSDQFADAMFEAGCDDALFGSRHQTIYADFSREADSLKEAILSAIADIRGAGVGAGVLSVDEGNLVTKAEIGRRIGRTRQMVHQYAMGTRGPGGFPPPACEISDGNPVWDWREVADWLSRQGIIDEETARDADVVNSINLALGYQRLTQRSPELAGEINRSLHANATLRSA